MIQPVNTIADLRLLIGGVGMLASVNATNGTYAWRTGLVSPIDNGVTVILVPGITDAGWILQMGDSGVTTITNASITNGALDTVVLTKSIKGNILGTNRIISFILIFNITSTVSLLPTFTLKITYGSGSITLVNNLLVGGALAGKSCVLQGRIFANGSTSSQGVYGAILQDNATLGTGGTIVTNGNFSVNAIQDQNLQILASLSSTAGAVTINFIGANITIV